MPFLLYKESMKRKLLLITLGVALAGSAWAQSTNSTNTPPANPPPPGGPPPGGHHHLDLSKILTPEERQELDAAHAAAIKANPDLGAQEKELIGEMQEAHDSGEPPDPALFTQMADLRKKLHDAMIKADPKIKPILAKLDAAMKLHFHLPGGAGSPGGPPPPPQQQGQQGQPPPTNNAPSGN
jgi:Spy/CpxP family protein refolding chaperone